MYNRGADNNRGAFVYNTRQSQISKKIIYDLPPIENKNKGKDVKYINKSGIGGYYLKPISGYSRLII